MNCTTSSLGTRSGSSVVPSLPFELAEADGNAADPSDPQPQHTSSSPSLPRYCNSSKPRSGQVSESPQALRFRPEKVACSHTEKSNLFNCDSGSRCLEFAGWSWLWASDEVSTHHPQIDEAASAADIRSGVTSASVNIEQNNKFGMNLVGCLPAVSSTAYSSAGAARVVPALSPDGMLDPTCLQAGSTQCGSVRWSSEDGPAKNSTGSSASVVVTTRTPPEHYSTASRARNTTGKWASPAIAIAAVTLMALSTAGVEAQDGVPDVDDSIPQTCTLLEIWGNQGHFSQYINGKFHVGHDEGDGLIANGRDAYQKVRLQVVKRIPHCTCQDFIYFSLRTGFFFFSISLSTLWMIQLQVLFTQFAC